MTVRDLDRSRFSRRGGTSKSVYESPGSGYFYTGRSFIRAEEIDLTNVRVLANLVDTVRQLCSGVPNIKLLASLQLDYESAYHPQVEYFGHSWILGGAASGGFQYMLRNNELGIIIHLINKYIKPVDSDSSEPSYDFPEATHLKIECSPHFLLSRSYAEVQEFLDEIADQFFAGVWQHVGCAVHLAADIAGIGDRIPEQFRDRFTTRSTLRNQYSPLDSVDAATHIVQYGHEQSILYGKPDHAQFNFYNKSVQAIAIDKLDFWQNIWLQKKDIHDQPIYRMGEPVMRVEFRLHHSVVQQFVPASAIDYAKNENIPLCDVQTGEIITIGTLKNYKLGDHIYQRADVDLTNATEFRPLNSYLEVSKYLDSLWRYCLKNFRLHLRPKSTYIDPLWMVLRDDISWNTQPIIFKRSYGKKTEGVEKNIGLLVGNALTLISRMGERFGVAQMTSQLFKLLRKSAFWKDIFFHYFKKTFYAEYLDYKKKIMYSGFIREPTDWSAHIDKSTFNQVICYIRDEVITAGIRKRLLIGKAAV